MKGSFYRAKVSSNKDPENLGRVEISYLNLPQEVTSQYGRISNIWAGKEEGASLAPEDGDEVVVFCEAGDMEAPFIIGSLYSEKNTPYSDFSSIQKEFAGVNTPKGNLFKMDDSKGKGNITFINSSTSQIKLEDSKIAFGSSGTHLLEILAEMVQAILDGQDQLISTAMGPGSLNPGASQKLDKYVSKMEKLTTSLD
jgi:uncharacterized protein involved in type VI secretion and phage assembly